MAGFADLGNEIGALRDKIKVQEEQLYRWADELSDRRQAVIPGYEQKVVDMLTQLAMPYAQLKIENRKLDHLSPTGLDGASFYLLPTGGRLQQIKDVASGEKCRALPWLPNPGCQCNSAAYADFRRNRLGHFRRCGPQNGQYPAQPIQVPGGDRTHSPQVASKADRHYFVFKVDKPDRTITNVRLLSDDDRVRAIAVMLSQSPPVSRLW